MKQGMAGGSKVDVSWVTVRWPRRERMPWAIGREHSSTENAGAEGRGLIGNL